MKSDNSKAFKGVLAILACLALIAGIGFLSFRTGSPEYKAKSNAQKSEIYECDKCTAQWRVTLYSADGWVDTGIQLKKGESVHVSPAPRNISGFYNTVLMRLNGKEENCRGRSPVKSNQTLFLRYNGAGDFGLFRDYIVAEVRVQPWEF